MKSLSPYCISLIAILAIAVSPAHAQWTEPVRISEPGGCLYPQIITKDDTLHVVYTNLSGGVRVGYLRSENGGGSWSQPEVISDTVNTSETLYPRIIQYGNNLMVVWQAYFLHWPYGYNIGYSISPDDGVSWTTSEYVLNQNWSFPFYLTASGTDSIINVVVYGYPQDTAIFYSIRSTNFGASWLPPNQMFSAAQSSFADIVSSDSVVLFSWGGCFDVNSQWELYLTGSFDNGNTWSDHIMLSDNDLHPSYLPTLARDDYGNFSLGWMDLKYSPYWFTGDILVRMNNGEWDNWTVESQVSNNHLSELPDIVSNNETLYVVWQDERPENGHFSVYYSKSDDAGESWSDEYRLDPDQYESRNPALALSEGWVYAIWADDRCDPDTDICGGIYFTRLESEVAVEESDGDLLPNDYSMAVYPNPSNSKALISLNIGKGGDTEIAIFDVNGRLVKSIFKGGRLEKGTHNFTWDATDASGKAVSSGLYFAVASTPQGKITRTLTLIR